MLEQFGFHSVESQLVFLTQPSCMPATDLGKSDTVTGQTTRVSICKDHHLAVLGNIKGHNEEHNRVASAFWDHPWLFLVCFPSGCTYILHFD